MAEQKYRFFKKKDTNPTGLLIGTHFFNRENVHRFEDGKVPPAVMLQKQKGVLVECTEADWLKTQKPATTEQPKQTETEKPSGKKKPATAEQVDPKAVEPTETVEPTKTDEPKK